MAHERGPGDRAVERWMRGEIGALGHHRDARARIGGGSATAAKMVSTAGWMTALPVFEPRSAGHHGARFGEWVDRNGRRSRGV